MDLKTTFDNLNKAALDELVSQLQQEHLHLDFKTIKNASLKSTNDLRTLTRAISGFANSDGGIVIWGVDARPDADGVDAANGLKPIASLSQLLSRLNQLTGEAAAPRVDGVLHKTIPFDGDAGCSHAHSSERRRPAHGQTRGE